MLSTGVDLVAVAVVFVHLASGEKMAVAVVAELADGAHADDGVVDIVSNQVQEWMIGVENLLRLHNVGVVRLRLVLVSLGRFRLRALLVNFHQHLVHNVFVKVVAVKKTSIKLLLNSN